MTATADAGPGRTTAAHLVATALAHRDEQVDRLRGWVHHETPSGDAAAVATFVDVLAARWVELGGVATTHPSPAGPHLVVDLPGTPPTGTPPPPDADAPAESPVLLVTHSDTVWPVGTIAGRVPWTRDGDRLAGPGVYDMKGGLAVIDGALTILRQLGVGHRPVRVVATADEEVGSPTARDVLLDAARGCRGALGFEPPHPDGAVKLGRYGSTRLRLTVTGRAAHAALDLASGVSAIEELVDQLVAARAVAHDAGPAVLYNPGTIGGGGRTNVVADAAWADLGLRFADPVAESTVLAALRALPARRADAALAWTTLASRPAWQGCDADRAWHTELVTAGAASGMDVPSARPALGAADTNVLGATGVPCLDGFGPRGGGAHAEHEHISLDSLTERTTLLAALLARGPWPAVVEAS